MQVSVGLSKALENPVLVASQDWHGIRGVFFETPHSTMNPIAIAGFGVLGIASRVDWIVMDIRFGAGAVFNSPQAAAEPHAVFMLRNTALQVRLDTEVFDREVPIMKGKFGMLEDLEDKTQLPTATESEAAAFVADLPRLADLRERGALSEGEFAEAKRKLLEND